MKSYITDITMHFTMLVLVGVLYPALLLGIGYFSGDAALGFPIRVNNKIIGYENIGQQFTSAGYFQGRPSAVDYNAAGSGGSNKSNTNPDYLKLVTDRKADFLKANPAANGKQIPSDLVTASGSGLDPHISVESALLQVDRVARARNLDIGWVESLVLNNISRPPLGLYGETVNVLKLNIVLDAFSNH